MASIFLRFYRSPSVSEEKGAGIGLYLAREIIGKEGGYIKGCGHFCLPIPYFPEIPQ